MRISDWSSDVCSSDLAEILLATALRATAFQNQHFGIEQGFHRIQVACGKRVTKRIDYSHGLLGIGWDIHRRCGNSRMRVRLGCRSIRMGLCGRGAGVAKGERADEKRCESFHR